MFSLEDAHLTGKVIGSMSVGTDYCYICWVPLPLVWLLTQGFFTGCSDAVSRIRSVLTGCLLHERGRFILIKADATRDTMNVVLIPSTPCGDACHVLSRLEAHLTTE